MTTVYAQSISRQKIITHISCIFEVWQYTYTLEH